MKENTFLNNVKTKASTLGMTALLTLNSVSLAFAEQTGLLACILMMMGDKKRTEALDRLLWIAIALCVGSALASVVEYLWQPK